MSLERMSFSLAAAAERNGRRFYFILRIFSFTPPIHPAQRIFVKISQLLNDVGGWRRWLAENEDGKWEEKVVKRFDKWIVEQMEKFFVGGTFRKRKWIFFILLLVRDTLRRANQRRCSDWTMQKWKWHAKSAEQQWAVSNEMAAFLLALFGASPSRVAHCWAQFFPRSFIRPMTRAMVVRSPNRYRSIRVTATDT